MLTEDHGGRPGFPAGSGCSLARELVTMADGDGGTPVAGWLAQPTLWRQAGGQQRRRLAMLDRYQERAAIDRVLDSARMGLSGTLVLRGGHGTGKTTLLEYAIGSAPDLRLSRAVGVE